MMFTRPQIRLLLSILAVLFATTQANWLDANVFYKRQGGIINSALSGIASGIGGDSSSSSASITAVGSSSSPGSTSATTTGDSSSSSSTSSSSSRSTPAPTTSSSSSTSSSSTPTTSSSPTTSDASTSLSESVHVTTQIATITQDGSTFTSSMTSSSTSTSTSTSSASLNDNGSSGSKGMSTGTRNAIIGACVGVGGAALIGALTFVFFKLRRNKREQEESDGLMGFRTGVGSPHEKIGSASGGAPNRFQDTLETYHAPPKNANVASNF